MRSSRLTIIALAFACGAPLAAQEPTRPRPAEPPTPTLPPALLRQEALVLDAALAPLAATLPEALSAVGMALPHALHAAGMALTAVEATLPHSLAAVSMALPHAFSAVGPDEAADDFADFDVAAPEPWAPQDPADSLYSAARAALNDGNFALAARLFSRIHSESRLRGSEYRALSYYYEALARTRVGGRAELRRAKTSLEEMRRLHAAAWTDQRDASALLARVDADLARLGDAGATRDVQVRVNSATRDPCTDANLGTKVEALNALLQMDADRALPILEEVLKNRSTDACTADLRRKAVFLISQKHTERTAGILLDLARNDPDPEVQEQAVFWLSQVRGDESIAALESILTTTQNPKVREQAIFAVSQHNSPRAAELLRDFALRTDIPAELRGNAIFWLGQKGSAENIRFLRELYPRLNDQEVKEKLLFAMSQIRGEESADWLVARALDQNESVEIRKNALFWAGQQRSIPIARLSELYEQMPDGELKQHLVFVLSQRAGDPAALELLIRIARTEKDPELRKNAIFWLGQSKDPRAAAFLLELIRS